MKEISYINKANQTINIQYEYKDFGNCKILSGKKTLINGSVNNKSIPPFYINGHASEAKIKSSVSSMRLNRRYLKNA